MKTGPLVLKFMHFLKFHNFNHFTGNISKQFKDTAINVSHYTDLYMVKNLIVACVCIDISPGLNKAQAACLICPRNGLQFFLEILFLVTK